jgi:hypothetical protein
MPAAWPSVIAQVIGVVIDTNESKSVKVTGIRSRLTSGQRWGGVAFARLDC